MYQMLFVCNEHVQNASRLAIERKDAKVERKAKQEERRQGMEMELEGKEDLDGATQDLPSADVLGRLLCVVWDALLDVDDLSTATTSLMAALVALHHILPACSRDQHAFHSVWALLEDAPSLIPRLLPLFRHPASSVRRSAVQTVFTLLSRHDIAGDRAWRELLPQLLLLTFQNILLETEDTAVVTASMDVWNAVVSWWKDGNSCVLWTEVLSVCNNLSLSE